MNTCGTAVENAATLGASHPRGDRARNAAATALTGGVVLDASAVPLAVLGLES